MKTEPVCQTLRLALKRTEQVDHIIDRVNRGHAYMVNRALRRLQRGLVSEPIEVIAWASRYIFECYLNLSFTNDPSKPDNERVVKGYIGGKEIQIRKSLKELAKHGPSFSEIVVDETLKGFELGWEEFAVRHGFNVRKGAQLRETENQKQLAELYAAPKDYETFYKLACVYAHPSPYAAAGEPNGMIEDDGSELYDHRIILAYGAILYARKITGAIPRPEVAQSGAGRILGDRCFLKVCRSSASPGDRCFRGTTIENNQPFPFQALLKYSLTLLITSGGTGREAALAFASTCSARREPMMMLETSGAASR